MRPEQLTQLTERKEQLLDLALKESDQKKWPGNKTREQRGDLYWHKKNALATLNLVARIHHILTCEGLEKDNPEEPEQSIEQEAAALEKQGVALLRKHASKKGR